MDMIKILDLAKQLVNEVDVNEIEYIDVDFNKYPDGTKRLSISIDWPRLLEEQKSQTVR